MNLKVHKGIQAFLTHHGLIKLIVSYSLKKLKHTILWTDFINMDMQAFEEEKVEMSEEDRKKGEEPKNITMSKISKYKKKEKKKRK
jgi:hypothetical protein